MYLYLSIALTVTFFITAYPSSGLKEVKGRENIVHSILKDSSIKDTAQFKDTSDQKINTTDEITARKIIDNYIEAIGGKDKLYGVIDRTTIMSGSVQDIDISIIIYQKAPNKRKQVTKVGSNKQEIIYNGERGITKMGGKEEEIKGTELEKLKYESTIALLPDLEYYGITLDFEGTETVDSAETYKIVMTLPSGIKWTQYYDTETHLKVKESKYIQTPGGLFEQEIRYDDYREIEGILYPFKIVQKLGNQVMDFTVISIKVNTGLIDREFEIK
jgi:zinc protease